MVRAVIVMVGVEILILAGYAAAAETPTTGKSAKAAKTDDAAKLFAPNAVWSLHVKIAAREWESMQPVTPPRGPGMGPGGPMRMEFPFVHGDVEFEGRTYANVGVRFKGNSSFRAPGPGLKRPLKIDFNRFTAGQKFFGMTTINLSNNAMDPSQMRELLAYEVCRAAQVPASRTTYMKVYLTVNGQHEREYLGLYTMVEDVGKAFLKSRFTSSKGLLLKPERAMGLPFLGESWDQYKQRYDPQDDASPKMQKRFIQFIKAVHDPDEQSFRKQIESCMDVDEFLRFIAANTILSNLDSFLGTGHNFYLYLDPKTDKIVWIPWDLNEAFGGFVVAGPSEGQINLSIDHPYMGPNLLIERILAVPQWREVYHGHLRALLDASFGPKVMRPRIEALRSAVAEALAEEAKRPGTMDQFVGRLVRQKPDLDVFVTRRSESVLAQLEGRSPGQVIVPRQMPGAPGFRGQGAVAGRLMRAADRDGDGRLSPDEATGQLRRMFGRADRNGDGMLDERELSDALERLLMPPEGEGRRQPPGPRAGGGNPPGPQPIEP